MFWRLMPDLVWLSISFTLFHSNDYVGLCLSLSDHFYHGCEFGTAVDILRSDGTKTLSMLAVNGKRNHSQGHSIFTYRRTRTRPWWRPFNMEGEMFRYQKCSADHCFYNQRVDCRIFDHPIRYHNDSVSECAVSSSGPLSVLHLHFFVRRTVRKIVFDRFVVSHPEPSSETDYTQNMVSCRGRDRHFSFLSTRCLVPFPDWRFSSLNSRLHWWTHNWHHVCKHACDLLRNRGAKVKRVCSGVRFCCDWRRGDHRWLVRIAGRALAATSLFKCGAW